MYQIPHGSRPGLWAPIVMHAAIAALRRGKPAPSLKERSPRGAWPGWQEPPTSPPRVWLPPVEGKGCMGPHRLSWTGYARPAPQPASRAATGIPTGRPSNRDRRPRTGSSISALHSSDVAAITGPRGPPLHTRRDPNHRVPQSTRPAAPSDMRQGQRPHSKDAGWGCTARAWAQTRMQTESLRRTPPESTLQRVGLGN